MTGQLFPELDARFSDEFKLSITRALADQLADSLKKLQPAPLAPAQLDQLLPRPGVYELFVGQRKVYVGKTAKSLQERLTQHRRKLSGRSNIDLNEINFQCLYVDEDLDAASPEKLLIKKYKSDGGVPWNTNGFGNKDPGRNRDNSLVKSNHFDAIYPINLDLAIDADEPAVGVKHKTVKTYLSAVKGSLPFLLRFETKKSEAKRDYLCPMVEIPPGELTARVLIRLALAALPEGWQATALPGYLILYGEEANYDSALVVWRKTDGVILETSGAAKFDAPGEINEDQSDEE